MTRIVWASPYSLLGVLVGGVGLLSGGHVRLSGGVLEFYGGFTRWFVQHLPTGAHTLGVTWGHVILGQSAQALEYAAEHERVHVRQFELWGPLMGPAYLSASLYVWLRGGHAYLDNPFEIAAYRKAP
ncbi:MAG: hypothetical protein KF752_07750 [Pirellulaceae bacterium]|nr:hypothetical protein [Pirellulaceae bacterium]